MITTGYGAKLMVEILPQIRGAYAPAVRWAMDQSKSSEAVSYTHLTLPTILLV